MRMAVVCQSTGVELASTPETFDGVQQRIRLVAESNAEYAYEIADEFREEIETLKDQNISDSEFDRLFDRITETSKAKIIAAVDKAAEYIKSMLRAARSRLALNDKQTKLLLSYTEQCLGITERALWAVFDLLKALVLSIRNGIVVVVDAITSVARKVADFVTDAVSAIQQVFMGV